MPDAKANETEKMLLYVNPHVMPGVMVNEMV